MPTSSDVIVVGAGASGLAAASALASAGLGVEVLEARERIGGRIFTQRVSDLEVPIELGAEFIHGEAPEIRTVAARHRLAMLDITSHRVMSSRGRLTTMTDFWTRLGRVMRCLDPERRVDRSFADALRANRGRLSALDRSLALQFVEGFDAAAAADISERALAEGGSPDSESRDWRIGRMVDGYDTLIERMADPIRARIRLGIVVSAIRWSRGSATVEWHDHSGATLGALSARAVIVTVPVGVLTAPPGTLGAITFDPPIPRVERALAHTTMGAVVKLTLSFDHAFWFDKQFGAHRGRDDLDRLSFLHSRTRMPFPVWWSSYPIRAPVLVGWMGGPMARDVSRLSFADRESRALEALATLLSMTPKAIRTLHTGTFHHDWVSDPFSRGAYSYSRVGGHRSPHSLAMPMRGTVWFAGEGADRQSRIGTVHAAIASGWHAARQVAHRL